MADVESSGYTVAPSAEIDSGKKETVTSPGSMPQTIGSFWASVAYQEPPPDVTATAEDYQSAGGLAGVAAWIDNYFRIKDRGTSFYIEFTGGMTTFFAMCYIMVLNGIIIGGPYNTGLDPQGVFFSTTVAAGTFTTLMGLFVNVPVALAPGMGLNGFFATIALTCQANPTGDIDGPHCDSWGNTTLPWSDAMGAVFISGIFYIFFTVTGLRAMLFQAVPKSLRASISVGIGFFITIIGLTIGQITRVQLLNWGLASIIPAPYGDCFELPKDEGGGWVCNNNVDLLFTYRNLAIATFPTNPAARVAVCGLVLVSLLEMWKVKGSIIISIVIATFIGINYWNCTSLDTGNSCVTDLSSWNNGAPKFIADPSKSPAGKLTFRYANTGIFWNAVFTFMFVELFDSFGTLSAIAERIGFFAKGQEVGMSLVNKAMLVDGTGLFFGAVIGSNSVTCYIESMTGVEAGARTGFASFVTGSAFFLSLLFVAPFVGIIPDSATTCALVMVGVKTLVGAQDINFKDPVDAFVGFITIAIMGFTYSISNGICAGFIFFSWLRVMRGIQLKVAEATGQEWMMPSKDVETDFPHPLMLIMATFMVLRFAYLKA